jgi:hypothetical protein
MLTHVAREAFARAVAGKARGICGSRRFPLPLINGENSEFNPASKSELLFCPGEDFLNKLLVGFIGHLFIVAGIT